MFLNDERFGEVVRGTYTCSGECPYGSVYETVNDGWLIISAGYFESLLYNRVNEAVSSGYMKGLLRQEIIDEYLEGQKQEKVNREHNLAQVNRNRKKEGMHRKSQITAMVLMGFTKDEIMADVGYSKSTVNKALQGMDGLEAAEMYRRYRDSVFADVPSENLDAFIKSGCNYKAFRKWLSGRGGQKEG